MDPKHFVRLQNDYPRPCVALVSLYACCDAVIAGQRRKASPCQHTMSALRDGPAPAGNATRDSSSLINVDDSDLDPAAFLKSVRELSEKREREDNERFRKLEAEIEKGRQERLARRAGVYCECLY